MSSVTGLTADRMLAIEAASVVDGEVVGNDLILTRHDGVTINAGNVRGATGAPGVDAVPSDVNPTAGTNALRGTAGVVKGGTPSATNDLTTKAYVDAADTAINNIVKGVELGNAVNLNTLTTTGMYFQSSDAEAAAGTNYPMAKGGMLEVISNANSSIIVQKYHAQDAQSKQYYVRTFAAAAWTAWQVYEAAKIVDTGWINLTHSAGWSIANADDQFQYRVRNQVVYIRGVAVGTFTAGTYHTIVAAGLLPAAYRVDRTMRGGAAGQSAKGAAFQLLTDGTIAVGTFVTPVPAWAGVTVSYPVA